MDGRKFERYAAKLGWIHSAPDKEYKDKSKKTRADILSISDTYSHALNLPEIEGADHLAGWISEIGLCKQGGFGLIPIEWPDIESWSNMTGTTITPVEAVSLISASRSYCAEISKGEDPKREAPDDERGYGYSPEVVSAMVDANIKNIIKDQAKEKK